MPGKTLVVAIPRRPQFRGGRSWCNHAPPTDYGDRTLIQALKSAHRMLADEGLSPNDVLRDAQAPTSPYHRRLCRLAFLAPQIQAAILEGAQPVGLTLARLMEATLPLAWEDQVRSLLEAS
jgi:site-specific DNA recombinase